MAKAYSNDLRERVAASVIGGRSCRETAKLFGVSVASAVKWAQRLRATGSAAARPVGRAQPRKLAAEREWLLARLEAKPDLTIRGLAAELAGRGVVAHHVSVWRIVRARDLSFKKRCLPPSRTGPTWPASANAGKRGSTGSIQSASSSSTRHGRRPT